MDENTIDALYIEGTPLERAIEQWKHGNRIPLTLATELLEQGYDVQALEARYRN
jgi:hypothetical protein